MLQGDFMSDIIDELNNRIETLEKKVRHLESRFRACICSECEQELTCLERPGG